MRQQRIDSFRLYAMFLIICGHVAAYGNIDFSPWPTKIAGYLLSMGVRYTVPFFFILAGYFVSRKISQEPSKAILIAGVYSLRLLVVFLFWCFVYAIEQPQVFLELLEEPIRLIFEGTRIHLWFLVSLILTVWLYALWPYRKNYRSFLLLGALLYIIGLLAGSYKVTPLGFDLHFDTRNGIFFSTLFFAIGVAFQNTKLPRMSWKAAAAFALGGLIFYSLEALCLKIFFKAAIPYHDYLLGSVPYGIGVFLLAVTQPDNTLDKFVGPYGRYMLGIYVIHFLFLDLFKPIGLWVHPYVWLVIYPILVFGFSLSACILIGRTPLRKLIQ